MTNYNSPAQDRIVAAMQPGVVYTAKELLPLVGKDVTDQKQHQLTQQLLALIAKGIVVYAEPPRGRLARKYKLKVSHTKWRDLKASKQIEEPKQGVTLGLGEKVQVVGMFMVGDEIHVQFDNGMLMKEV